MLQVCTSKNLANQAGSRLKGEIHKGTHEPGFVSLEGQSTYLKNIPR